MGRSSSTSEASTSSSGEDVYSMVDPAPEETVVTMHSTAGPEGAVLDGNAAPKEKEDKGFPVFNPKSFRPYSFETYKKDFGQVKLEFLAGITVAFAQVPEAVAFGFLAGVEPDVSLHAAWIMGLLCALFGSRPGMICGATGAIGAVLASPVREHGVQILPYVIIICGLVEMVMGLIGATRFIRLIPATVMVGFTNGMAIIIAASQLHAFKTTEYQYPDSHEQWIWNYAPAGGGDTFGLMFAHIVITVFIVKFFPKLTKVIPSALVALLVAMGLEQLLRLAYPLGTPLVGEVIPVKGGAPLPFFINERYDTMPAFSWDTLVITFPVGFFCAMVSIVESLFTVEVVNDITETPIEAPDQQIFVMGVASVIAGFFGTMAGGPLIGLSIVNLRAGANGRYRISAVVMSVAVALVILAASVVVEVVPTAALVGVMVVVVVHTFNWASLLLIAVACMPASLRSHPKMAWAHKYTERKIPRVDAGVIVICTALSYLTDIFIAVVVGVALTAIAFSWTASKELVIPTEVVTDKQGRRTMVYHVEGLVFFATAQPIVHMFDYAGDAASVDAVEIHFGHGEVVDYSGMQALNEVANKYKEKGLPVHIRRLGNTSSRLLVKAGNIVQSFTFTEVEQQDEPMKDPVRLAVLNKHDAPV